MAAVHIRDVHKHFGGTHVIRGVDALLGDVTLDELDPRHPGIVAPTDSRTNQVCAKD